MKRISILVAAVLLLVIAGGGWFVYSNTGDPVREARAQMQKGDLRSASIQLRNAVRDNPANGEAHYLLGQAQLAQGDAVAAEKEIKAARDLNWDRNALSLSLSQSYAAQGKFKEILAEPIPDSLTPEQRADILTLRALAQSSLQNPAAAKVSLAEAERIAPKNVDARLLSARLALADRDASLAETKVDEAIALDPKRADAIQFKAQLKMNAGDRQGALDLMDKSVAAAPTQSSFKLDRANLLLNLGQDVKARADVDSVLAKEPKNAVATYLSLVLNVRAGKFPEAEQDLVKLDPVIARFPRGRYFEALIKANRGQVEQAVELAERYVARAPNDPDGVRLLARTQMAARRPARAVDVLNKAIAAGQKDAETMDLLGRAYAQAGQSPQAARSFEQASTLAPSSPDILTRLASSKMQMGDAAGATSALERSLEIAPNQASTGEALVAAALSSGDLDRAQAALDRLRQQAGETEPVSLLTGALRLARLDVDGAREQFESTVKTFPDSVAAKLNLAKVLLLQNKRPEAMALLETVLAKDRANTQALTVLVQVLLAENRGADAMKAVEAARVAAPTNLAILAGQAELAARLGDANKGLAVLDAARNNSPTPAALLPELARLQVAAGKLDAAKITFAQILSANPNNLDLRRAQVELLLNSGDVDAARASLQAGLKLSPGNFGMLSALALIEQRAKGLDAAVATAEQLRREPANMPAAALLKGDLYMAAKKFDEAEQAYATEFKAAPSTALAIRLANAQAAAGHKDQSLLGLRAWQAKQPADPDLAQTLASIDIVDRRYADAEKNLQIVLDQRPNDIIALNNMAWVLQSKGDKRARALAQRAYLQAPSAETSDTLGWIMVGDGDAAKALPLLQQASGQLPKNSSIKYHLAAALKAADKREEAIGLLKALVDDPAEFEEKAAARQLLEQLTAAK